MGAEQSTESATKIVNQIMNESVTNVLQKNKNNITTDIKAGQTARFLVEGSDIECTNGVALINQEMKGSMTIASNISQETTTELKTLLENAASSNSDQMNKMMTEFLGGMSKMDAKTKSDIENKIKSVITTNITVDNVNEILNRISAQQNGDVVIKNSKFRGVCTINQNMALSIQANNILGNIVKTVMDNKAVSGIINEVKQKNEIEAKGLADVVDKLGQAVANVTKAVGGVVQAASMPLTVGIVAVVVLVLGTGGVGFLKFAGGGATGKVDSAGNPIFAPAKTGLKIVGIILLVLVLCALIYTGLAFAFKWAPFYEKQDPPKYPEGIIGNSECEKIYDNTKPILIEYQKKVEDEKEANKLSDTDENKAKKQAATDAKNKFLLDNKDKIKEYEKCIPKKETFTRQYSKNSDQNYVYKMRGVLTDL